MGQLSCCTSDTRTAGAEVDVSNPLINAKTGKSSLYTYETSKKELQGLLLPEDFVVPLEVLTAQERETGLVILNIKSLEFKQYDECGELLCRRCRWVYRSSCQCRYTG